MYWGRRIELESENGEVLLIMFNQVILEMFLKAYNWGGVAVAVVIAITMARVWLYF